MGDPNANITQAAAPGPAHAATLIGAIGAAAAALVLVLVPHFEGTVLWGYRDPGGVVTACTGNTSHAVLGRRYTPSECQRLLETDLVRHAADLRCVKRPLQPHETAALLSFVFNVGHGQAGKKDGLCELKRGGPSSIVRLANAGDMPGACAAIERWTYVAGRDCALTENRRFCGGIVTRRQAERAMCEGRYLGAPMPSGGAL